MSGIITQHISAASSEKTQDYYVRLFTGLMGLAVFFGVTAFASQFMFKEYSDFVRQEGRTFYYGSVDELLGSAGQALAAGVLAAGTLAVAIGLAIAHFRMGTGKNVSAFFNIVVICAIAGGMLGFIVNGAIQAMLLGQLLGNRGLFWVFIPLLYLGGLFGALAYAKGGSGTILDT